MLRVMLRICVAQNNLIVFKNRAHKQSIDVTAYLVEEAPVVARRQDGIWQGDQNNAVIGKVGVVERLAAGPCLEQRSDSVQQRHG